MESDRLYWAIRAALADLIAIRDGNTDGDIHRSISELYDASVADGYDMADFASDVEPD